MVIHPKVTYPKVTYRMVRTHQFHPHPALHRAFHPQTVDLTAILQSLRPNHLTVRQQPTSHQQATLR
jgi:hypothetical protein